MRQSYTNKFHSFTYVHAFNILYNKQGQLEKSLREVPVRTSLLFFKVASKQNKRLEKHKYPRKNSILESGIHRKWSKKPGFRQKN